MAIEQYQERFRNTFMQDREREKAETKADRDFDLVDFQGITMYRYEVEEYKKRESYAKDQEAAVEFLKSLTEEYDFNDKLLPSAVVRDDIYDLYQDWLEGKRRYADTKGAYFGPDMNSITYGGIQLYRVKDLPIPGQMLAKGLTPT